MIALAIIVAGVSSIFISSLAFANAIHKRALADENRPTKESIAAKRRVLERRRDGWYKGAGTDGISAGSAAMKDVLDIDEQLLALADEEARCID